MADVRHDFVLHERPNLVVGKEAMQPAQMLAQLARDGAAMLSAANDLHAPVPTCPGWTVRDVLLHTGEVYAHKTAIVAGDSAGPPQPWPPARQIRDEREWFDEQLHALIETLRRHQPTSHVWTWYTPDQTVRFWVRRMMHETVIHRADVELAAGPPTAVGDTVALDGIDELLECFLCFNAEAYATAAGHGERVTVRAADQVWTVTLAPGRAILSREPVADPDGRLSGPPSDLLLALWNRLPYTSLRTSGDAALAVVRAAVAATTQ